MVKLRGGQRSNSMCRSASVSSWASSTTMCANGPASQVRIGGGQRVLVDQGVLRVLTGVLLQALSGSAATRSRAARTIGDSRTRDGTASVACRKARSPAVAAVSVSPNPGSP